MAIKTHPDSRNNGAALIIFILGLVLVLYIFSISPEERSNLLEDSEIESYDFSEESLGYIYPDERTYTHEIAPVNIVVQKEDEQIFSYDNIEIKQSIFYKEEFNLNTTLSKNYDYLNLLITFDEKIGPQDAYIMVNGYEMEFPNNLPVKNIMIPEEVIGDSSSLVIKIKFKNNFLNLFTKEVYTIKSISLVGSILDKTSSLATRVFTLKPQEEAYLDSSIATFIVSCNEDTMINIKLNDFTILNEQIECDSVVNCNMINGTEVCIDKVLEKAYSIEIPKYSFKYDQNNIEFQLLEGKASVNKFSITNRLIPILPKTFEFKISDRVLYSMNTDKNYTIYLEAQVQNFESSGNNDDEFDLFINGDKIRAETQSGILLLDITKYVTKSNIIWIDTDDTLYINYMKAYFE